MAYTKLFSSIVTSTIWSEDDRTRIVWITMLALADKNGEVQASIPGLAKVAGVSIDACESAIQRFLSPDPYSRTKDDEGRRIEEIQGGWMLLNYGKYRLMASKDEARASNAERQRRHRDRQKRNGKGVTGNGSVTHHRDIAEAEAEAEEEYSEIEPQKPKKPARLSSETYVSSPPTVSPEEAGRQATPNFSEKEEGPEAPVAPLSETGFLSLARKMGIPEAFAVVVYSELIGRGWRTADGKPVLSPSAVLKGAWDREQAKPSRTNPGEPRKREPWMVEADIKRIKAEVKRITDDPASRYASKGYSATWEQHQDQFREAWLAVVRACHDEAREKLPEDFRAFEASLAEAREEMRKGAAMLGQDPGAADSEDVRLAHFVSFFPEDCPDFARWDREWNRAKSWRDPKGLTEDAKTEIKILKGQLSALENERRALLVGVG